MSNNNPSIPFHPYSQFYHGYQPFPYSYYPYENLQWPMQYNYFQFPFIENQTLVHLSQPTYEQNLHTSLIEQNQPEENSQNQARNSTIQNRKKKNPKRSNKYQKRQRNFNSIVLRNFLNFIHGHPQIVSIVETIIKKKHLLIDAVEYLELLKQNLPPKQSYVAIRKVKSFIDLNKEKAGIKIITLILLKKFIHENFFVVLVHLKKVSTSAREKQLRHGKKFWNFFVRQIL